MSVTVSKGHLLHPLPLHSSKSRATGRVEVSQAASAPLSVSVTDKQPRSLESPRGQHAALPTNQASCQRRSLSAKAIFFTRSHSARTPLVEIPSHASQRSRRRGFSSRFRASAQTHVRSKPAHSPAGERRFGARTGASSKATTLSSSSLERPDSRTTSAISARRASDSSVSSQSSDKAHHNRSRFEATVFLSAVPTSAGSSGIAPTSYAERDARTPNSIL